MREMFGDTPERADEQHPGEQVEERTDQAARREDGPEVPGPRPARVRSAPHLRSIGLRLAELRHELQAEIDHCARDLRSDVEETADEDDSSTQASRSMSVKAMQHLMERMRDLDQALERLGRGEYGLCEDCGGRIPAARLRANPLARMCVPCQERLDRGRSRWRR